MGRHFAEQFQGEFETATAPQQFGLASNGGVETAVHMLRTITAADPTATITQIDGVGAYDHLKRSCMLGALARTPQGNFKPKLTGLFGFVAGALSRRPPGRLQAKAHEFFSAQAKESEIKLVRAALRAKAPAQSI